MKEYSAYGFSAINLKRDVAQRFREFSRQVSVSHSETLESVMNFFEWNELSPNDNLGIKNDGTKKRINALIAIIKNIEKNQTKPTTAMLQKLFEEAAKEEEEEDYDFGTPVLITENEELEYYRNEYENLKEQQLRLQDIMDNLFNKTILIKKSFSSDFYRLDLTKDEFQNLKKQLTDVYHNHSTKDRG